MSNLYPFEKGKRGVPNAARMNRYASIFSGAGQEALARATESPSVQRISSGVLKVDDLLGMTEEQATCAFGIIRWSESGGLPACPKCRMDAPYWLSDRGAWKCRTCHHQFSMTSGTVLSHRKVPIRNYLFALSMVLDRSQFSSLLAFTKEIGLSYKSAHTTVAKLHACTVGAGGCTVPFSLLERAAWLLRRAHVRSNLGRFSWGVSHLNYPYLRETKPDEGADLLMFVNGIVPRGLPDYMRADICQDIIVSLLAGEATCEQVSRDAKSWITKVLQASPWKYKWMSFDAPFGGDESDGRSLHDVLAAPEGMSFDDAVAVTCSEHGIDGRGKRDRRRVRA